MSKALKCDICGKLFESQLSVPDLRINKYKHPYGDEWLDLCDSCQNKLEQFVEGKLLQI